MNVWPVNPAANFLPHPSLPGSTFSKPRVGLGVICRCQPNTVECLLLRRGPRFVSPLKWSFPGGRLGERGDLDDDGVKGTERELLKECGGGNPRGLPQLIHIECYKSQKTLYHVYAVDWEDQPEWLHWNPARTEEHTGEIDTMATELQIQDHTFKAVEGFCWVSLHTLVEECMSIGTTDQDKINASALQHGLIRWVIANGETILKILSARSPKLAHHKRYPPSSSSSSLSISSSALNAPNVGYHRSMASGQFRQVAFFGKGKRYLAGSAGGGGNDQFLLAPPLFPSQLLHPTAMAAASTQLTAANQGLTSAGHASSSGGGVYPMSQDFQSGMLTLQVPMGSGVYGTQQPSPLLSQEQMALVQQQQQPGRQSNGLPQQPNSMYIQPGVGHVTPQQVPGLVGAGSGQGSAQNPPRPSTGNGEQSLGGYVHPESALGETGLAPGMVGMQGLPPQAFPATAGLTNASTSTAHSNPALSTHPSLGMDPVAVAVAGGPQHQPEGSALLSSPQVPSPISSVMQAVRTVADHQPSAMVNSALAVTHGEFGPIHHQSHAHGSPIRRQPPPTARNDVCRHFLNGHCHYGDSCWFLHPEPPLYMRRRDPLLGPGGIMTSSPLPLPLSTAWLSSGSFMDHHMPHQYGPQSPPQSPLSVVNPGLNSASWQQIAAIAAANSSRLPIGHANLGGAGGLPGPQMRPLVYAGARFAGSHTQLPPSTITDPVLRFKLLSEVVMRDGNGSIVANISHLAVRADHFYSCFAGTVRDYKVLFGGERRCSESHTLTAERSFNRCVSCIHSSKLLPSLLVVGTEDGSIFTWDLKRGGNNSVPIPVHEAEEFEEPVTALVHFTTTIAGAQVVVSGNKQGVVSWYIAQPPMKTYIVLASRKFDASSPVMSLQILGGYLIAGSRNGTVYMWSMRSQEPEFFSQFQAHNESLLDIHIIDSSSFLTVGVDSGRSPCLTALPPSGPSTSATTVTERVEATGQISLESKQAPDAPPHTAVDTVSSELASLTIVPNSASQPPHITPYLTQSSSLYNVSLWDFGKPVRKIKTQEVTGPILSTNFHQQPMFGNRFLAMGLTNGAVKIYNLPSFSVASEIRFPDIENKDCIFVALNLSREKENTHHVNVKNPFRDLILTTVWSDGRIMVCQTDRKF